MTPDKLVWNNMPLDGWKDMTEEQIKEELMQHTCSHPQEDACKGTASGCKCLRCAEDYSDYGLE